MPNDDSDSVSINVASPVAQRTEIGQAHQQALPQTIIPEREYTVCPLELITLITKLQAFAKEQRAFEFNQR